MTNPPAEAAMIEMAPPVKKSRPLSLHGKVLNVIDSEEIAPYKTEARMRMEHAVSRQEEIARQTFERRSTFSKLIHETQQFQKLVADLDGILSQSGESPEASWRARIIIRSTQEAEKDLWDKLYKYEHSLLTPESGAGEAKDKENSQRELRTAQTACMKLHRDFNRSHKILIMVLTLHEKRQKAEASRVRAVRWGGEKKDEDYFDRAMREREKELGRMNQSMHKVNEIYHEIAALVDGQQEDIDLLEDNVNDSATTVQSSVDEINCFFERDRFCGAMRFGDMAEMADDMRYDCKPLDCTKLEGEEKQESPFLRPEIRKGEVFDWFMPFENIGEDMKSVHRDIVRMGKDILQKGGEYTCESKSSKA
jgi:hypothetical protein